jgi:ankyrin repeat protein
LDCSTQWADDDLVRPDEGPFSFNASIKEDWKHWNTPLHLAVLVWDYESVKLILQHGADINLYNHNGYMAIQAAVDREKPDQVRFLLANGADPNKPSRDGHVALHVAMGNGDESSFFALLENGANLEAALHADWTMLDLVLLAGESALLARLMSDEYNLQPSPWVYPGKKSHDSISGDLAAMAEGLLAVSSSSRLLPPGSPYGAYHLLVSSLNISRDRMWHISSADALIESVKNAFHEKQICPDPR